MPSAAQVQPPRLSRTGGDGREAAPVRIVHLGLGNFFRAHQAWYTDRAPDAAGWGIAAFTGRRTDVADALAPQDGLYTLVTRGRDGDELSVVGSVTRVHPSTDHAAWLGYLRDDRVAIVTMTVTEAGYHRSAAGGLDANDAQVAADVRALREDLGAPVRTVPARLLAGLVARDAAGAGPIALVPCDNLPGNGAVVEQVVLEAADAVDPSLREVVRRTARFATTMVDRITPRTTDDDRAYVARETGRRDAAPVVTEPFSEWVVSGEFPAGAPDWAAAGALLVDDVEPFERRKLWLLNGAHSLLAYAGSIRGHETVADAMADDTCREWLQEWWDEATAHLTLPAQDLDDYRAALSERFSNPRIRHLLAQIAADGSQKVPVRILPTLRAERTRGRDGRGAARVLAAWVCHLRGHGAPVDDTQADALAPLVAGPLVDAVRRVLGHLDADLARDADLVTLVVESARELAPS